MPRCFEFTCKIFELRFRAAEIVSIIHSSSPIQNQQNQNPAQTPSSFQSPSAQPQVTEEKFSLKNNFDFSDKKVIMFIAILFALLFIVPYAIFKLKKRKKVNANIQNPQLNPPVNPPKTE